MILKYISVAMDQAHYEFLKGDKKFYGEIPSCKGVYATGKTLEECRRELAEVLEDWILLRVAKNLSIPMIKGIRLNVKEVGV